MAGFHFHPLGVFPTMANIKSAEKRARQSSAQHLANHAAKSDVSAFRKRFLAAVEKGDKAVATAAFDAFSSRLDKAAKKGILKKNNASRRKARAAAKLAALA